MRLRCVAALALSVLCGGCMVGPDYHRPTAPVAAHYKELKGWTIVYPEDTAARGPWWEIYHDPLLDSLERRVNINNQTVKEFEAAYRNSVELVREAQSGLFPTLGANAGVTRAGGGGGSGGGSSIGGGSVIGGGRGPSTLETLEGSADWAPDVWGKIRREVESQTAAAEVSAADLADAQLSAQTTLATDYFSLRAQDLLQQLLQDTEAAYRHALQITQNQYNAGTISRADVVTAEAQLQSVVAQLAGVGVLRAQYEHAIAMLTGATPDQLSIPFMPLPTAIPVVPPGVPSTLLERRPDIAAAERGMQEENALIGVAIAGYYPTISLSALGGFIGSPIGDLLHAANGVLVYRCCGERADLRGGIASGAGCCGARDV